MTPDELQAGVRDSSLIAVTQQFVESLKVLGIKSYVIGYALTEDPQGQGLTKIEGNATLVLNLIAAMLKSIRPEDFHNLLVLMQHSEFFAEQRGDKPKPAKKEMVN